MQVGHRTAALRSLPPNPPPPAAFTGSCHTFHQPHTRAGLGHLQVPEPAGEVLAVAGRRDSCGRLRVLLAHGEHCSWSRLTRSLAASHRGSVQCLVGNAASPLKVAMVMGNRHRFRLLAAASEGSGQRVGECQPCSTHSHYNPVYVYICVCLYINTYIHTFFARKPLQNLFEEVS